MLSGVEAARHTIAMIRDGRKSRRRGGNMSGTSMADRARCGGLIRQFYQHSFRELFLNGTGPIQMHKAVISVLAGRCFRGPIGVCAGELRLFDLCVWLNQYLPLCRGANGFHCWRLSRSSGPLPWRRGEAQQAFGS